MEQEQSQVETAIVRQIENDDYTSLLHLYSQFTGESYTIKQEEYEAFLSSLTNAQRLYVIEVEGQVIGCGTLLVESKLIHNGSRVAHIEDVVIDEEFRSMGYGRQLIRRLIELAEEEGVYKVILNCSEEKVGFYLACGMDQKGVQMAIYF